MFIVLRQYELNTLVRRLDDEDHADLTKARVLANSLRCSEDRVVSALQTAVGSLDTLLYLDLRLLPDHLREGPSGLPPLEIPEPARFAYSEQPTMKMLRTYRLDYLLARESREREAPYELVEGGETTLVIPATPLESVASSLECEADALRDAVKLISSPANGDLSWLRITVHNDALRPGRPLDGFLPWAEPQSQIRI